MSAIPQDAVLLIIDVQKGFNQPSWGHRNNLEAEENIAHLLDSWRRTHRPVIIVQHMSTEPNSTLRPGQIGNELKDEFKPLPGEMLIQKQVNSAFIGTDLEAQLRAHGWNTLVITGLTTDHCVSTTTRMAGNLGFKAYVVSDGTATFDRVGPDGKHYAAEDIHAHALTSLHGEFATVVPTDEVLKALAITA